MFSNSGELRVEDSAIRIAETRAEGGIPSTMPRKLVAVAVCVALLHIGIITFLHKPVFFSSLALAVASGIAAVACYWRSTLCSGATRTRWNFAAIALALWTVGQLAYTYEGSSALRNALPSDFYFFLYGIPLLLAISSSQQDHDYTSLLILDSLQAILAVCLAYVQLFAFRESGAPIGGNRLQEAYFVEDLGLVLASALRLLGRPRGEAKLFYWLVFGYLTSFFVAFQGPVVFAHATQIAVTGAWLDIVCDIPFLLFAIAVVRAPRNPQTEAIPETNSIALLMDNCSPILFTLAVLAVGASIARHHFKLGIASIAIALFIYCFRAAILQSAYMRTQSALTASQDALRDANNRLQQLSFLDSLTGIPNRRQFDLCLIKEWDRAIRFRTPLSLLMIDIDFFKNLNDHYGHPYGDECLARVASALQSSLRRPHDMVARYGGEEFAVILPNVDAAGALKIADTMRQAVADLELTHAASGIHGYVTISVGASTQQPRRDHSAENLLTSADSALYQAKCSGRNRVETMPVPQNAVQSPR
jgi:diguanylate cyclase (GGDEF)-like protein